MAGITQSFLSGLENGNTLPSIPTLYAVSGALDLKPADLLPVTGEGQPAAHSLPYENAGEDAMVTILSGAVRDQWELSRYVVPAGYGESGDHRHDGEDFIFVLEGALAVVRPGERIDISTGDTVWLDGRIPHHIESVTGGRFLIATVERAEQR